MAGYGLALVCPKCLPKDYFGMLKTPGNKAKPCPNCGTALVALRRLKRAAVESTSDLAGNWWVNDLVLEQTREA